jgi:hypothetical protein
MALKTRGKMIALGLATFAASAALAFGTVAAASNGNDRPALRITQDQSTGGVQQTQETPRAPGDGRDCPFGHGPNGNGSSGNGPSDNSGTVSPGDL